MTGPAWMMVSGLLLVWLGLIWEETNQSTKQENKMNDNMNDVMTRPADSGCVNAPNLGIWRVQGQWMLGRKRDGMLLPGSVVGSLDRARRCWHALSVLHTDAAGIIERLEDDVDAARVLRDWERLTD